MTKTNLPRIQFRLSKTTDEDLIKVFQPIYDSPNGDITAEAKRLIRQGLKYDSLSRDEGAIIVSAPIKVRLTSMQQNFIQVTRDLKQLI